MINSVVSYFKEKVDSLAPLQEKAKPIVRVGLAALVGYLAYCTELPVPAAPLLPTFQQPMSLPLPTGSELNQAIFEMGHMCSLHCTSFHPNKTSLLDAAAVIWISQKVIKEAAGYAWSFSSPAILSALQKASAGLDHNFLYYACTDTAPLIHNSQKLIRHEENRLQKAELRNSEFTVEDPRNKVLWLQSARENDEAFYLYPGYPLLRGLTRTFQVKWIEIASPQDLCQAIRLYGDQLAGIVISAHGSQHALTLEKEGSRSMSIQDIPRECFASLHPYTVIFLDSCLTASSNDIQPNFASQLQKIAQRTVIGARMRVYGQCISLTGSNLTDIAIYFFHHRYCLNSHLSGARCPSSTWSHPHLTFCSSDRIDVTYS